MNRLVLIGNGFDLAHGLKTSYADFINWYWEQWGERLMRNSDSIISDEFCSFKLNNIGVRDWYLVRDWYFQKRNMDANEFIHRVINDRVLCEFVITSYFLQRINVKVETKMWVDIENIYYDLLTMIMGNVTTPGLRNYEKLNCELNSLREKLIVYLKSEEKKKILLHDEIKDKIYRPIESCEVSVMFKQMPKDFFSLSNIMLLNFNYTKTPEMYLDGTASINYIHGKLDAPQSVIFGYGDELDENYNRLKEQNDIECMRQVKSIRYLEYDNYRRLLEFIESDPFQVVIMGHSCGNSDRTLLNTLFEHRNCVSIKPYFYIKPDKTDSYSELTININRNFTDPKQMRDRVVNKEYCEPLIGVKPGVIVMG